MRPEFLPQPSRELRREISGREPADVGAERKEEHSAVNPVETLGGNVGPYPSFPPPRVAGAWRFEEPMV